VPESIETLSNIYKMKKNLKLGQLVKKKLWKIYTCKQI